jgi:uncharacterized membrane protein YozB (DUF420 family)
MNEILHGAGFLGTAGNFAADMTLVMSLVVALTFTVGMFLAWAGKYDLHGRVQTVGAIINLILVGWMMVLPFRDFVVRDMDIPRSRDNIFYAITILHAIVGVTALVFGNFVVLRGHNLMIPALKFNNYKPFMRMAYALYMAATFLGICVYIIWFVVIPNPPVF